jgi:hypothetical protein
MLRPVISLAGFSLAEVGQGLCGATSGDTACTSAYATKLLVTVGGSHRLSLANKIAGGCQRASFSPKR